eukprot:TRINITY_DN1598_c0_g1_i1.p1 TRINITY_DN1598_c0_g1~~TRINITY_DN1598_c0_g1_i1.p1  ORF type:complete len:336 (-),score=85.47 TRINITY_DN1598_c0_g1_i1:200-1207(-)
MGAVHVGEVFKSYLSIKNNSNVELSNIVVKAELQATVMRHVLLDNSANPISSSSPNQSHDFIVSKEIEEDGFHVLVCAATYTKPDGERQIFRKYFKFSVDKPFEISFRSLSHQSDSVYVEAQIRSNISNFLFLDSVSFIPSLHFSVDDLNIDPNARFSSSSGMAMELAFLPPGGINNFLFRLHPKDESKSKLLGQVEITWNNALGEKGRFKSEPVLRQLPVQREVELQLIGVPQQIILETPFTVQCEITNKTDRPMNAKLFLVKSKMSGIMVNGFSGQSLGQIHPNSSKSIPLTLFPIQPGVQKITGIQVVESTNDKRFDFDNFLDVFVESNADG